MNKHPADIVKECLNVADKYVLDIGCGEGEIARVLARSGAHVTGLEPNPKQIAKILSIASEDGETYVMAPGEKLPFPDNSIDIVIYNNALHHVPVDKQDAALEEAARVLRSGGALFVAEPLAEGPTFQLARIFNDETAVRTKAQEAIARIGASRLKQRKEFTYTKTNVHKDFEAYRERALRRSPGKEAQFAEREKEAREAFDTFGEKTPEGFAFEQPILVQLLVKE